MQPVSDDIKKFLALQGTTDGFERPQFIKLVQAVANIPWGEGRTLEEVLKTKHVGTCTGKHLVLAECCDALGIPYRTVVCTFRWSEQGLALPDDLQAILREGEWNHGHNFLQIQSSTKEWTDLDITWDPSLRSFGFLSLPKDWDGETSFVGLRRIVERTDGADISVKKQWLQSMTPDMQKRRERFLAGFFAWVKELRQ